MLLTRTGRWPRIVLATLVALCLCVVTLLAAIAVQDVGTSGAQGGGATTCDVTAQTVGSGEALFAFVATDLGTGTPSSVWDTAGDNEDMGSVIASEESSGRHYYAWFADGLTAGTDEEVNMTSLTSGAEGCISVAFSGLDGTTPHDSPIANTTSGANGTSCTTGSITTAGGDLALAWVTADTDESANFAVSSSNSTLIAGSAFACGAGGACSGALATDTDGGAVTFTWTGSRAYTCGGMNLNVSAGGGGTTGGQGLLIGVETPQ